MRVLYCLHDSYYRDSCSKRTTTTTTTHKTAILFSSSSSFFTDLGVAEAWEPTTGKRHVYHSSERNSQSSQWVSSLQSPPLPPSLSSSCFSSKFSCFQLSVHWGKHGFAQFSAMGPFWKRRSDLVNEHRDRDIEKDKDMGFVLFFNLLLENDKSHAMLMFSALCALWETLICAVPAIVLSER